MDKKEYAIHLLERLTTMIKENRHARKVFVMLENKLPSWYNDPDAHRMVYNSLSDDEKRVYSKGGVIHSRSAIQRVRIELNTILIEIEKGR